jgi:accessory gene regulator B
MIAAISKKMAQALAYNKIVHEENTDIYSYACELMLNFLCNIILTVVISLLLNRILEGLLFFISFVAIRHFTGGFHANKHWKCIAASALVLTIVLLLIPAITVNFNISFVISCAAGVLLIIFSPVGHKNKPVELNNRLRDKAKIFVILIMFIVLIIMFHAILLTAIAAVLCVAIIAAFGSVMIALVETYITSKGGIVKCRKAKRSLSKR